MELSALSAFFVKFGIVLVVLNEIRGAVMAAPVVWGLYQAGGSKWDWFVSACMLAGIAVSVIVPLMLAAWARERTQKQPAVVRVRD